MNETTKKAVLAAVACVALVGAGLVIVKTVSGNGDTNSGAQDEARKLVQGRSDTDKVDAATLEKIKTMGVGGGARMGPSKGGSNVVITPP